MNRPTLERFETSLSRKWMRCVAACAVFSLAVLLDVAPAGAQTLISLADGDVQGQINGATREFLGIPFAAPPVGPLRFRPPQPAVPWASTLDATAWPPGCSQLPTLTNGDTRIENEDCLFLNVWTPDPAPTEPLPVMIWIHGGSNATGSISDFVPFPGFEGQRLFEGHLLSSEGNVVVVTLNYRLNVFGFLGLSELAAEDAGHPYAGNQGLLDQRAGMQWVRDNIAAFGGDPDNVTIFGESAGSFDVCAHVLSPMSEGLFHRAISQSGGCTVGVQSTEDASAAADALTEIVGCDLAPDRLACLRGVPTDELLDAGPLLDLLPEGGGLGLSVDGGFLPEHPRETLDRRERRPKIPWILGANTDEGTLFAIGSPEITAAEYTAELIARYGGYAAEIEALYPATAFGTPRDALIRVSGDSSLVCSTYDVATRYAKRRQRTFVYHFARVPPLGVLDVLDLGAFHGLEIAYVFGSASPPTFNDERLGEQMRAYWSSFADRGRPKIRPGQRWGRFNRRSHKILRLNNSIELTRQYKRAECEFWSSLYDTGQF